MSARAATSAVARVTTVFRSAPGQLAASFSDPSKRLREIGSVVVMSFLEMSNLSQ